MYTYHALVTKVIDGDTIDVRIDLGFTVSVDVRLRLAGIDAAELRSGSPEQREKAQQAKQFVVDELLGKSIIVRTEKADKHGRWLGVVYVGLQLVSFNDRMISEGYAVEYR